MNILVTGGAGYIGSHTVRALMKSEEFTPFVFDNLSTGHRESVPEEVAFIEGDIHDIAFVAETMKRYEIDGVIHFAASSLVAESMVEPGKYYSNNVEGTLHLLLGMKKAGVDKIVFSSTAAVYGEPGKTPIEEDFPHNPTNVYGRTKLVIEDMMRDFTAAYGLSYVALRYFNAAGAAEGGMIGEAVDFNRPSFWLTVEKYDLTDGNRFLIRHDLQIRLTLYDELDEHYDASWYRLSQETDAVTELLIRGWMVGRRHLKPLLKVLPRDPDRAYVQINLSWMDNRPGLDTGASTPAADAYSVTVRGDIN